MTFSTAVCVILMGPYSMFGIGTGYAFTRAYKDLYVVLCVGTVSVYFGAMLGAIIAFFFGRYLCRSKVRKFTKKSRALKAIDMVMDT